MSNAADFVIENGVLKKYKGSGGDVVIPAGVTTIGYGAFDWFGGDDSLRSVTIPEGVTTIEAMAFFFCERLRSVTIPESVTTIGRRAFSGCCNLRDVTIPKGVTTIAEGTFEQCGSLRSITIPEGVTSIGKQAFYECYCLGSVTIPESVTTIGEWAFNSCHSLRSITIPEGVTTIGELAFEYCNRLTSITFPESVETIGREAFSCCDNLVSFGPLPSGCKCGKNLFGESMPDALYDSVGNMYAALTDGSLKKYVLTTSIWSKLTPELQAEIFMTRQGKSLVPVYEQCITAPDALGKNILARLSGKPSAKECSSAAAFMTIFSQKASVEILQQLYEALKPLKSAAKALKTIEADASLITKLNQNAKTDDLLS